MKAPRATSAPVFPQFFQHNKKLLHSLADDDVGKTRIWSIGSFPPFEWMNEFPSGFYPGALLDMVSWTSGKGSKLPIYFDQQQSAAIWSNFKTRERALPAVYSLAVDELKMVRKWMNECHIFFVSSLKSPPSPLSSLKFERDHRG